MSIAKIKLDAEQVKSLLTNGECSVVGGLYEVSSVGMFVEFDGVFRVVDAPEKRPVGRPKKEKTDADEAKVRRRVGRPSMRTHIFSREKEGVFIDKVNKFLVGDVVVSLMQGKDFGNTIERKAEVMAVEVKQARDISDAEWHSMGCNWSMECFADKSKSLHLSQSGLGLNDEVGLYWYREIEGE